MLTRHRARARADELGVAHDVHLSLSHDAGIASRRRGPRGPEELRVLEAAWWGFVGGAALLIGATSDLGAGLKAGDRADHGASARGAAQRGRVRADRRRRTPCAGADAVVLGLSCRRARPSSPATGSSTTAGGTGARAQRPGHRGVLRRHCVLGALLDGLPESAAIGDQPGRRRHRRASPYWPRVFLSNIPESMSASAGLIACRPQAGAGRARAVGRGDGGVDGRRAAVGVRRAGQRVAAGGRRHPGVRRRRDPDDAGRHDGAEAVEPLAGSSAW